MLVRQGKGKGRTIEQLREHYEIEKELASRLRGASRQERSHLYSFLYDELYRRVPYLSEKVSPEDTARAISSQLCFLRRFLSRDTTFLEIGPGDCSLSFEVAKLVNQVHSVDVSKEITRNLATPLNFRLVLSDGCSIPVPENSVDVAYSHQLMEHLHPDDASEQLQNVWKALTPGGIYICVTPNRLNGPHDISKHFDAVATGFHLKEYTTSELSDLFKTVGFSRVRAYVGARGFYISFPIRIIRLFESSLDALSCSIRRAITRNWPCRLLLGIRMVGTK